MDLDLGVDFGFDTGASGVTQSGAIRQLREHLRARLWRLPQGGFAGRRL
jgi:hypothetical protein